MRCLRCRGTGMVYHEAQTMTFATCPDCIGGVASCCEVTDDPAANEPHDKPEDER